jgi:parallel beta-helix repeat protein
MKRLVLAAGGLACVLGVSSACSAPQDSAVLSAAQHTASATVASNAVAVCAQKILNSPFSYNGKAGAYKSGKNGLPTYGTAKSDFPHDKAGVVLGGSRYYPSYKLEPNTVYYILPGVHYSSFQADTNDAFVGGLAKGVHSVLSGAYSTTQHEAIATNATIGNQPGVVIEYLTIEDFTPDGQAAAINQNSDTNWTIRYDTITHNVPGAGIIAGTNNVLRSNCLTQNGQYGFQSTTVTNVGQDKLTTGPYNVTVIGNEISYNDTCDFAGLITNKAIGWVNHNPVPAQYRNSHCGTVVGNGNQGGFKLWKTNGVTIKDNYIHNNWGPGIWADTNNANTTITGNRITDNESVAVIEEVSYNFAITDNYIAGNDITAGWGNSGFPAPAIYISESGSDREFGGIPACSEKSCAKQPSYVRESAIQGNVLSNNGGGIFLWQNSNRYCSSGIDGTCTLVDGGSSGPFSIASCAANLPTATLNLTTYRGNKTGSPAEDWWDGCMWKTENVSVTDNQIDFNPAAVPHCNKTAWPDCGANGSFSEYGGPSSSPGGWAIPTSITFFQNDVWSRNAYKGPSFFYAWNQGSGDNPVSWARWTGALSAGDKCSSASERQSGYCEGPFGQDKGSTYQG